MLFGSHMSGMTYHLYKFIFILVYLQEILFRVLENLLLVGSFSGCRNILLLCAEVEILHSVNQWTLAFKIIQTDFRRPKMACI